MSVGGIHVTDICCHVRSNDSTIEIKDGTVFVGGCKGDDKEGLALCGVMVLSPLVACAKYGHMVWRIGKFI